MTSYCRYLQYSKILHFQFVQFSWFLKMLESVKINIPKMLNFWVQSHYDNAFGKKFSFIWLCFNSLTTNANII